MKTKYSSYNLNGLPEGCKFCVKGEKLVLFISGICTRNCYYCSLSNKRKNKDIIWANERICKSPKDAIIETLESNAKSAGITGGDPLLFLDRTIKYAKNLKKRFGKKFHIHIYLPTKLVNKNKLKKLSRYIDEVRFNAEFSANPNPEVIAKDLNVLILANKFWEKQNIGLELPMIPERVNDYIKLISLASSYIGFVNLNEFELSETNFNHVTKKYKLDEGGYVIRDSKKAGIKILKKLEIAIKNKSLTKTTSGFGSRGRMASDLKIHFCTADLKNNYQFKNRLLRHKILPYGQRTNEGTVKYIVSLTKPKIKGNYFFDKKKKRFILSESLAKKIINKQKICLVEEFPTFDSIEVDVENLE